MSETYSPTGSVPVQESYIPPPSRFGGGGFSSVACTSVMDSANGEDPWLFGEPEQVTAAADSDREPAAEPDRHGPALGPRPARAVNWRGFDDIVLGVDSAEVDQSPAAAPYDRMATAALVVSLLGIVTGIGFVAGALTGQVALRRMSRAGWFECNEPARRRARNAVMIGCTGTALLVTGAILAAGWWFVQTPMETIIPGFDAGVTPAGTPAEGGAQ